MNSLAKPSRTKRLLDKRAARLGRQRKERDNKAVARRRDGGRCRFPLCGCRRFQLKAETRPEVSHDRHKGMGGDPSGARSLSEGLITLCLHRHQDGIISRHKGTLRTRYLTDRGNDGPVAWEIDLDRFCEISIAPAGAHRAANAGTGWVEVAREKAVQVLESLEPWQRAILTTLATMEL